MSLNSKGVDEVVSDKRGWKVYNVNGKKFEVESRYTITGLLGRGAYGYVCSAVDGTTKEKVAIKSVSGVFKGLVDGRRIWREVVVLRLLREHKCRNVLQLLRIQSPSESIVAFKDLYFVTDVFATDLDALNRDLSRFFTIRFIRIAILQLLQCVADVHELGIIHRDIKPSNVLLKDPEDPFSVALCDFGLARGGLRKCQLPMRMTDYVVTRWYRAPELLLGCPYDYAVDLWSIGCVLGECVLGQPLFPGKHYIHQLQLVLSSINVTGFDFIPTKSPSISIVYKLATRWKSFDPLEKKLADLPSDGLDLSLKLLAFEPRKRISAKDALSHGFFDDLEKSESEVQYRDHPEVDFGFDFHSDVGEGQLRRYLWNEISLYNSD